MQFKFTSYKQNMVLPVSDCDLSLADSCGDRAVPRFQRDRKIQELSPLSEINLEKALNSFLFQGSFLGYMDMYSDRNTVAEYLNTHEGWFCRCAQPMQVEPLGENGYILSVGQFNYFGYEVEPKIAVVLNPPQDGIYTMHTVPIPNYQAPGYEVLYQSMMGLQELDLQQTLGKQIKQIFKSQKSRPITMTRVSWTLDMSVTVDFPQFIDKLPSSLIQNTGDRLLAQIVRQISPRLTYKVQQDFHTRFNLPIPPKSGRKFDRIDLIRDLAPREGLRDRSNFQENRDCAA